MESISPEKNPLVEFILRGMKRRGIDTNKQLSVITGVPEANLSRFFNGSGIDHLHFCRLLKEFDLLKLEPQKPSSLSDQ
jgi:hypothetical protein